MSDIFKDMQANVGCDYISNLPSYKRKVWHEMKRLPLTNYDIKQLPALPCFHSSVSWKVKN